MYRIIIERFNIPKEAFLPSDKHIRSWTKTLLATKIAAAEITIRIVSQAESQRMNLQYRSKDKPTNVLSFPYDMAFGMPMKTPPIGDLVICAEVVNQEAAEQNKPPLSHWAHMVVHGLLHLLGFDHENLADAEVMESVEIDFLHKLGMANPYERRN